MTEEKERKASIAIPLLLRWTYSGTHLPLVKDQFKRVSISLSFKLCSGTIVTLMGISVTQ